MIVIVACFYGFRTSGGPAAVGESVARSMIVNVTLAHVIPALFVMNFYNIKTPNLNIGG
jgi:phospholipid/cholesterol/gamma-HCH transport system permease protein